MQQKAVYLLFSNVTKLATLEGDSFTKKKKYITSTGGCSYSFVYS